MSFSWYVLYSKPNKEDFLYNQLQFRGIEVFYPRLIVKPINPRSRKIKPFFPGYMFVRTDFYKKQFNSLSFIPGVNRIVSFGGEPASVPDSIIQTIKINLDYLNANPELQNPQLQHGDPVIIQGGPFDGYQAIFDRKIEGSERVRLFLKMLHGQQIPIQTPVKMIKPLKKPAHSY